MTHTYMQKLARKTAATFVSEFPGQVPGESWMAEAASVDRIPDSLSKAYFFRVHVEVRALAVQVITVRRASFIVHTLKRTIRPATQQAALRACLGYTPSTTEEQGRAAQLRREVLAEVCERFGEPEGGWSWSAEDGHPTYPLGG